MAAHRVADDRVEAMSVLRIFLAGDGACDWSLQDDQDDGGRPAAADGENTPYAELPRAARCVAIVPAARMRTLSVSVPPTPPAKLSSVVRFALEDQLAGDVESQHVVIAAQRERDVIVHVLDRRWLQSALAEPRAAARGPRASPPKATWHRAMRPRWERGCGAKMAAS